MTPLKTRGTEGENRPEAKCVEDGSIVLRSGTVKTPKLEKCGNPTVREVTEKFGNVTVQVGKMRVDAKPQKSRKQTMRNSFELAESRKPLTPMLRVNGLVIYMQM